MSWFYTLVLVSWLLFTGFGGLVSWLLYSGFGGFGKLVIIPLVW